MNFKDKLLGLNNGKYRKVIGALDVTDECLKCKAFNCKANDNYLCAVTGSYIGVTLSRRVNSHLLLLLGVITKDEYNELKCDVSTEGNET